MKNFRYAFFEDKYFLNFLEVAQFRNNIERKLARRLHFNKKQRLL